MINIEQLNESIAKAEEFITAAKGAKYYLQSQAQFNNVPTNRQPTYTTYGRPLANARRVSMPLTFSLAKLRKYSNYK
jgi:hypothetical protein